MIDAPAPLLRCIEEVEPLKAWPDAKQIPRAEGELLYELIARAGYRVGVEVGTSYGFSGLFIGAALLRVGGQLDTIDLLAGKTEHARDVFGRAGLAGVITCHTGDARDVLQNEVTGPLDFAFLDASRGQIFDYFERIWPRIRPGGAVFADNVVSHEHELRDYLAFVARLPDATTTRHRVGNGLEQTVKRAPAEARA